MLMCLLGLNLTFSIPIFAQLPTHQYTIFNKKNTQLCPNWVFFTIICSKYTQFLSFGLLLVWWKPTDQRDTKFCKKNIPKGRHIMYTMSKWESPHPCRWGVSSTPNQMPLPCIYQKNKSSGVAHIKFTFKCSAFLAGYICAFQI